MSPCPKSCSAPISPKIVRLSIFEVTWNEIRVGKFALIVPVITSTRWALRRQDHVDAGGAGHLGQALDRALDLLAGHHHQVRHLVDDHHDVRQRLRSITSSVYDSSPVDLSKPVSTVCVMTSPFALASDTRALKPSMLRTPSFAIFL